MFKFLAKLSSIDYLLLVLFIVPEIVFSFLPLYANESPAYIENHVLDYKYGIVQFFITIIGCILALKHRRAYFHLFVFFQFFRELTFLFFGSNSFLLEEAYEIYLIMLVGISLSYICYYLSNNSEQLFRLFLLLNVLTVYLSLIIGHDSDGRYSAFNLDVGSTGTLCAFALLLVLDDAKNSKWIWFFFIIGALLLSGSRSNLVLVVLCGSVKFIEAIKNFVLNKHKKIKPFRLLIVIFVATFFVYDGYQSFSSADDERYDYSNISSDASLLGRTLSIEAGINVLREHPLGISGFFINLQREIVKEGYPTFPHNYILSEYILLGPVIIIFLFWLVMILVGLYRNKSKYFNLILYFILMICVYGSPILNFKVFFMYAYLLMLAYPYSKYNKCNYSKVIK